MDRLITRTSWSLQSRRCRTGGRGGACDTGTRGVLQRSVRHEARHIREARLASTLADGQGRRRQCRRFLLPCTMGLRPPAASSASGKSSFNALCLPSWPDTNFSPLLISRKAPCGPSSRRLGRTAPPLDNSFKPRIAAIQGLVPGYALSCFGACAGGSRFGIADFPLRQDTFLGSC
jgi:hypothetical protein